MRRMRPNPRIKAIDLSFQFREQAIDRGPGRIALKGCFCEAGFCSNGCGYAAGGESLRMLKRLKSKLFAWILRRFMCCEKAAWLVSQSLDRRLSVRERTTLALHMKLCSHCAQFREQVEMLRKVLRMRDDVEGPDADLSVSLSQEARARIKKVLQESLDASKNGSKGNNEQ
jgi:hypothetical protein